MQTRTGLLNDTLAGKFLPGQAGSNPFLEAAIAAAQRPTEMALNDTLQRSLPGAFTAAGQRSVAACGRQMPISVPASTAFDMAAARAFEGGSRR